MKKYYNLTVGVDWKLHYVTFMVHTAVVILSKYSKLTLKLKHRAKTDAGLQNMFSPSSITTGRYSLGIICNEILTFRNLYLQCRSFVKTKVTQHVGRPHIIKFYFKFC